jgi:predicted dithiol-disulfide oxidoreductase (DUF899 family)
MADVPHTIVSHEEWIAARKALLVKEKEYTRLGDELARLRRELPFEGVEKEYIFDGPNGKESLSELFAGRSQLAVYHFMFGPEWNEGCRGCSFWADSFNGIDIHLAHRDVTFVAISHAALHKLQAFKLRMGWTFNWLSAGENGFNYDYQVSFTPEAIEKAEVIYNYGPAADSLRPEHARSAEHAGMSAFYKDAGGAIYHTYSGYARGLDALNVVYQWLDRMPKGRDEEGLAFTMSWVRHHDGYDAKNRSAG